MKFKKIKIILLTLIFVFLLATTSFCFTIVIDPGHGGIDGGAVAQDGTRERDLNLKIAKYLKEYFENYKVNVLMTHEGFSNGKYELIDRGLYIRSTNADLVISVHLNDSPASNYPQGAEVYVTANTSLEKYNKNSTELANKILENLGNLGINNRGVHTRLCSDSTDIYSDGTRADYYGIIRYSMRGTKIDYGKVYPNGAVEANIQNGEGIPTVLVEHCFVKGNDFEFINSDSKLKKLAEADGKAIVDYYNLKTKGSELFNDVDRDAWYYNAVEYVYKNNIITGYNKDIFAPEDKLTRGMLVTVLYRMEGSKSVSGMPKFPDVQDSSQYYFKAVKWATDNNIVSGYNTGYFGPNDNITREQLAVILNKYAKFKGKDVSAYNNLSSFKDRFSVSDYARTQMKWAVGAGVITGNSDGTLKPKGEATRAEAAAMLEKYCKKVGR
ncbi:MAG: S-layer homology domain-containing protein [Clostridia bacterium]|nr:S-layer homology domain-containing protein [Clostridia bacterium]